MMASRGVFHELRYVFNEDLGLLFDCFLHAEIFIHKHLDRVREGVRLLAA